MVLKKAMLIACMFVCVAAMAAPVTPPYFCGFEDEAENAEWVTWGGASLARMKHSTWITGGATFYTGRNGMYLSDLDIDSVGGNTHCIAKNGGYTTSAYRKVTLAAGDYTISLDYYCPTEMISVSLVSADTLTNTQIQTATGADYAAVVKNSIVSGLKDLKASKWLHTSAPQHITTAGTYLLTITFRSSTGPEMDFGAAVDNVEIVKQQTDQTACDFALSNLRLDYSNNTATLTWKGNADTYEVICYSPDGEILYSADTVSDSGALDICQIPIAAGDIVPGVYHFMVRGLGCGGNSAKTGWAYSHVDLSVRVAIACPEVTLTADSIIEDEKYILTSCEGLDTIRLVPKVVAGGGVIHGYRVDEIMYSECPFPFAIDSLPAEYRQRITRITSDDVWDTRRIILPFSVCFFDGTYRQALVGANGIVSFDPFIQTGSFCAWSLTNEPDIPSRDFIYKNCIMGVYQDYYPVPSAGGAQEIWYGVLGEFPCRKMVVCFNEVPMFANHTTINSSMIVMYEGTSVIDVYVKNRDLSPTGWNDNRGIIGIINIDGTDGIAAPGRNTTDGDQRRRGWTAHYEAWRFTPYATPEYNLSWYKGAFTDPTELDEYVASHPFMDVKIADADSIEITKEDEIDAVTVRMQYSLCNGELVDLLDHTRIAWSTPTTIKVDTAVCQGNMYSDQFVQNADSTGKYVVTIQNNLGCDSIVYELNLTVLPTDTMHIDTILCAGEMLDYEELHTNEPGDYQLTSKYARCDCDSVVKIVSLKALEPLNVAVQNDQTQVCGDDPVISLSYNVLSGRADKFDFVFDAEGLAAGFTNMMNQPVQSGAEIDIPIMQDGDVSFKRPGSYNATLTFFDKSECTDQSFDIHFDVLYPSSIIFQRWDDVLSVKNAEYNGGYEFSAYQWLKNGQIISDEEKSYLYEPQKLDLTAEYQVMLTDIDGKQMLSCPFIPQPNPNAVSVAPTTVRTGEFVWITVPESSEVEFYSMSGFRMKVASIESGNTMVAVPGTAGVYVVRLLMAEGARSFRITVTE